MDTSDTTHDVSPPSAFEAWAIVDLFGHQQLAGRVSEQQVAGVMFVRVDVPAVGALPAHSRLFSPKAIYGITPTTEEIARAVAHQKRSDPVTALALPAPARGSDQWAAEDDGDDEL